MPKVSIIIPVYNAEKYLHRCLDSIQRQTFPDWECILVDDGSPDGSGAICDEFSAKNPRFKVIHKENGGVSSARNIALDYASGEFVCLVDSDDWVENSYIENLYTPFSKCQCDLVVSGITKILPTGAKVTISYDDVTLTRNRFDDMFIQQKITRCNVTVSKMFKRSLISDIRYNTNVHLGEDILFLYSYLLKCNNIVFVSCCTYNYIINEGSLTSRIFPYINEKAGAVAYDEIMKKFRKNFLSKEGFVSAYSTFFTDRAINALYSNPCTYNERIKELSQMDLTLYTTYKKTNSLYSSLLLFLLRHKRFKVYNTFKKIH